MNLLKIQQKHARAERTWNATATSDICLSVTLLREAARPKEIVDAGHRNDKPGNMF